MSKEWYGLFELISADPISTTAEGSQCRIGTGFALMGQALRRIENNGPEKRVVLKNLVA